MKAIARDGWQRQDILAYCLFLAVTSIVIYAAIHAILSKRDSRSAAGWVGLILLSPIVGTVLYAVLGVNRIRRRAFLLRREARWSPEGIALGRFHRSTELFAHHADPTWERARLAKTIENVTHAPLLKGNSVNVFSSFEKMADSLVEAIEGAKYSISLATYIFDGGEFGDRFVKPLGDAVKRQVAVRVLIDGVGARYSWPSAARALRRAGVPCSLFLPTTVPWQWPYMNLRNHRKLLIADGCRAFTGGMNLRKSYLSSTAPDRQIHDLHFEMQGPVVQQLQEAFAADWNFCSREVLNGDAWFPNLITHGEVLARAIPDGPDEDFEKIRWSLLGAISLAKQSIRIVTPYFLPDSALVTALSIASLSGIQVEVLVPDKNNLMLVDWASMVAFPQLLANGCRIFRTLNGFDHSKLMLIDDDWVMIGSSNWDERSLRLNFELNVECYNKPLAKTLLELFERKRLQSRELTLSEISSKPLLTRIRNGISHLLSPYL